MDKTEPFNRVIAVSLFALLLGPVVTAQYFGQNKVRFKTMDFEILMTEHFDIYFYPEERQEAELAGQMAERWYQHHSQILNAKLRPHQPIILYDSAPSFRATTVLPGEIGVGTGGVTEGMKGRVILPFGSDLRETNHVLGHELVHAFQYAVTSGPHGSAMAGASAISTLPLWFVEGMAEYLSLGGEDPDTAMWLRAAAQENKLPSYKQLDDPQYFPYRYGQAFWAYVGRTYGDDAIGKMLRAAGVAHSAGSAIQSVLHMKPSLLMERWATELNDLDDPILQATTPLTDNTTTVLEGTQQHPMNVSPAISPDGKHLVVFTDRNLFSIEAYLVDPMTGKFLHRITNTATDDHFDNMQFVNSAGVWSPDSKQFAFAAVDTGRPLIAIWDVDRDKVVDEIKAPELGQILHLSWAPDGKRIVFSAMKDGETDLFTTSTDNKQIQQVTHDLYSELYPAWSPSGDYIIFSTDRYTTDLQDLTFQHLELAVLDINSGEVTRAIPASAGKQIDPHWGADDNTVFFISDMTGISNVYRLDRQSGDVTQLTNAQTGVTGIASLSPALSVATETGKVVFSSFLFNGAYSVHSIETGQPGVTSTLDYATVATLPPTQRTENSQQQVSEMVPLEIPPESDFKTEPYHPKLSLDYVAPPSISAGVSNYGAAIGGGAGFYFSDMLEQHQVMASIQTISAQSSTNVFRNLSGMATYQNRTHRWTWGLMAGQSPYLSGYYTSGVANVSGQTVGVQSNVTYWQINRQVTGLLSYPFNRATRVEFAAGAQHIGFAAQAYNTYYNPYTGVAIGAGYQNIATPSGLSMAQSSVSLVHDTTVMGPLDPMAGTRYRIEFGGQAGTLNYTTGLFDYRRYFRLPKNLTIATRLMHFGRYGAGGEDYRLQNFTIGYPSLVRGYSVYSFTSADCGSTLQTTGACPAYSQLFGSRMAVGNFEVRVPMLGPVGLIRSRAFVPVEMAPFFDVGIAWRGQETTSYFLTHARKPVRSYGVSMRANIFGAFVAQLSYVNPMDRPLGWHWEFAVVPGF